MNDGISSIRSSKEECIGPDILKEALNSSGQESNASLNQSQVESSSSSSSSQLHLEGAPEEFASLAARRWYLHRQQARMNSFIAQNQSVSSGTGFILPNFITNSKQLNWCIF
jgi:hypothetical protein